MESFSSKNKPKKPVEPALDALRAEFNLTSGFQEVERLEQLKQLVMSMVTDTLREMRKFVERNNVKVVTNKLSMQEIRAQAIRQGRRPTLADQLQLSKTVGKVSSLILLSLVF